MASLVRYNPVNELQREVQRMFDEFFPMQRAETESTVWTPSVDMAESADAYLIRLDLPGMKKEDVTISFENGLLQITGERKATEEQGNPQYHRVERWYGRFFRSIRFDRNVKPDGIRAQFEDGVLKIEVPKAEESRPRKIEIS